MNRPQYLKRGDRIGIIPPAGPVLRDYIEKSVGILEGWGLQVKLSTNIYDTYHHFAGQDNKRLQSLQEMLDDNNLKAIICARGGYGTTRIIDSLSFDRFLHNPAWLVGFSDITALLIKINNLDMECIHGPMPITFRPEHDPESLHFLKDLLFGNENIQYRIRPHERNVKGTSEGPIIGGNISLLCNCIGTSTDFDTSGKILFLEDTDEYLYRFDRLMVHLKRAGKLRDLAGLIVGHLSNMKENETPFGADAAEIVSEHVEEYGYPLCFGAPIGHQSPNYPIPVGRQTSLNIMSESAVISFKR